MKYILLAMISIFILSGCSAKQINETTDSIITDVTTAFEDSRDKSGDVSTDQNQTSTQ